MRTLGNILWHFPCLGFLNAAAAFLLGAILTATGIAAPIGLGLIEFGKFLLAPFGHAMISRSSLEIEQNKAWRTYSALVTIVYLPFGIFLAALTILQTAFCFFTIIGIPIAVILAKSVGTYFNPVNKKCVHAAVVDELERRKAQAAVTRHLGPPTPV
jgi:uncharacterized membrane protein YccF (DUF307 family)